MIRKMMLSLFLLSLLLTGCSDLVEIQDRDFVLALGISYENGQYQVTYSLPDLGKVTEQSVSSGKSSLLRIYRGKSLAEIEQCYNSNSENRLDYRHLQVIILDSSLCSNPQAMENLLLQINDYYNISHNVLIYFYESGVEELMEMNGVNSSIGEHLQKLNNNNHINGMEPAKIGTLMDCISNERTLFIPALSYRNNSIAVDGGVFFCDNQEVKQLSQMDSDFYFITLGKSNDYLIRLTPEHLVQLKEVKANLHYDLTEQGPDIQIQITGSAKAIPGNTAGGFPSKEKMDEYIRINIEQELDSFMKKDRIDYLNLYEKSSYKSRQMWLRYENRHFDFIDDVVVSVSVDMNYE